MQIEIVHRKRKCTGIYGKIHYGPEPAAETYCNYCFCCMSCLCIGASTSVYAMQYNNKIRTVAMSSNNKNGAFIKLHSFMNPLNNNKLFINNKKVRQRHVTRLTAIFHDNAGKPVTEFLLSGCYWNQG